MTNDRARHYEASLRRPPSGSRLEFLAEGMVLLGREPFLVDACGWHPYLGRPEHFEKAEARRLERIKQAGEALGESTAKRYQAEFPDWRTTVAKLPEGLFANIASKIIWSEWRDLLDGMERQHPKYYRFSVFNPQTYQIDDDGRYPSELVGDIAYWARGLGKSDRQVAEYLNAGTTRRANATRIKHDHIYRARTGYIEKFLATKQPTVSLNHAMWAFAVTEMKLTVLEELERRSLNSGKFRHHSGAALATAIDQACDFNECCQRVAKFDAIDAAISNVMHAAAKCEQRSEAA